MSISRFCILRVQMNNIVIRSQIENVTSKSPCEKRVHSKYGKVRIYNAVKQFVFECFTI